MKQTNRTETSKPAPEFIASLFKPTAKKQSGRKVWSIDLETVWLPFFTATNVKGVTDIPKDAIGCPLRLGYNDDGSVKFSKNGRAVIRLSKEISNNVTLVRENFVAGLQNFANTVHAENEQAYNDMVKACVKAGKPIAEADKANLEEAMRAQVEAAIAEAEAQANGKSEAEAGHTETGTPETNRELVTA